MHKENNLSTTISRYLRYSLISKHFIPQNLSKSAFIFSLQSHAFIYLSVYSSFLSINPNSSKCI